MLFVFVVSPDSSESMFLISLVCYASILATVPDVCLMLVISTVYCVFKDWSRAVLVVYYEERVLVSLSSLACLL